MLVQESDPSAGKPPPPRAANDDVPAGAITAVEPTRLLEYAWLHDGAPAGTVRWQLTPSDLAGTRLVLSQTLPARLADLRASVLAAWQTHPELFYATVHGVDRCEGRGWPTERTEGLRRKYAERPAVAERRSTEAARRRITPPRSTPLPGSRPRLAPRPRPGS